MNHQNSLSPPNVYFNSIIFISNSFCCIEYINFIGEHGKAKACSSNTTRDKKKLILYLMCQKHISIFADIHDPRYWFIAVIQNFVSRSNFSFINRTKSAINFDRDEYQWFILTVQTVFTWCDCIGNYPNEFCTFFFYHISSLRNLDFSYVSTKSANTCQQKIVNMFSFYLVVKLFFSYQE